MGSELGPHCLQPSLCAKLIQKWVLTASFTYRSPELCTESQRAFFLLALEDILEDSKACVAIATL